MLGLLTPLALLPLLQDAGDAPYEQRFVPRSGRAFAPDSSPRELPFKAVWVSAMLKNSVGVEGWYWAEIKPAEDGSFRVDLRLQKNARDLESASVPLGTGAARGIRASHDESADTTTFSSPDGEAFRLRFGADAVRVRDTTVSGTELLELACVPLDRVLEWEFHDRENQKDYFFHSLLCTATGTMSGKPVTGLVSLDMFWGTVGEGLWGEESVIFQELEDAWIIYYHQTPSGEPAYGTLFLGQGGWAGGYTSEGLGQARLTSSPVIRSTTLDPLTRTPTSITVEPGGTFTAVARMDTLGTWGCWMRAVRSGAEEPQFAWWEHVIQPTDK